MEPKLSLVAEWFTDIFYGVCIVKRRKRCVLGVSGGSSTNPNAQTLFHISNEQLCPLHKHDVRRFLHLSTMLKTHFFLKIAMIRVRDKTIILALEQMGQWGSLSKLL